MPDPTPRAPARPQVGEERVFVDDVGRRWRAALARRSESAVLFACLTEPRAAVRAIATDHALEEGGGAGVPATGGRLASLSDVSDETLRAWLAAAPPVARLT